MFCAILVTKNGSHLGMPNRKKIQTASYKKHSGTKLDQFHPMVLEISLVLCLCYFSNSLWHPSLIVNLQKFDIFLLQIKTASYKKNSGTNVDQFQPMILQILSFLSVC